jgi:hypothetical protein
LLATLCIFTQNSDNHFCCLTSSNVLFIQLLVFLSKLRAKKVEKLHNSSFYRNFRYRERLFPVLSIMKKKINPDRPTLRFFWHVTVNTHIFFWPKQSGSSIVNQIPFYYPRHPHLVHLKSYLKYGQRVNVV